MRHRFWFLLLTSLVVVASAFSQPGIVIDANKDAFYEALTGPDNGWVHIPAAMANDNGMPSNNADKSVDLWAAWDDTYIYVYEEVVDDVVHVNNPTSYQNDVMEVYVDPNPSLGKTSGQLGFQMTALDTADVDSVNWPGITNLTGYNCTLGSTTADYARKLTANGYALECRVKWELLKHNDGTWGPFVPAVGKIFGMSVMNHDNDVAAREGTVQWGAVLKDACWNDPRLHGTITLLADNKLEFVAENAIVPTNVNEKAWMYVPGVDLFDITIDAKKDAWYGELTGPDEGYVHIPFFMNNDDGRPDNNKDLSANLWVAWDPSYLYFYEEITDNVVHLNNATSWQDDCLEVYYDPDPSQGKTSGQLGFHMSALDSADVDSVNWAGVSNLTGYNANLGSTKADYARAKTANGFILEGRVKWDSLKSTAVAGWGPLTPEVGKVFGMSTMNHDNDVSTRESSITWAAVMKDAVWNNPTFHGSVTFEDGHKLKMEAKNAIVPDSVNAQAWAYVPGQDYFDIAIDAVKDPWFADLSGPTQGHVVLPSAVYNGNGAPRDDKDLSSKIWTAWDDTYFYLYEEVMDDTVHITNATNWQNDCIELKIDPDPSKKASSGVKEVTMTALDSVDTDPAFWGGIANLTNVPATKADYARKLITGGYALELRLKWSDIAVSGRGPVVPAIGTVFGMGINNHDNDKSARQASVEWAAALDDAIWSNPKLHGKVTFQADHKLLMEAKNAIVDTLVNPLAALYVPSGLPAPMLTMNIGKTKKTGTVSYDPVAKAYTISGGGADIWDVKDAFNFAFQQVTGDVEITAKLESLTKSDPWTKACLMVRDDLTPGSVHALMATASDNGLAFQYRPKKDSASVHIGGLGTIKPPYYMKLIRLGQTLTGWASENGKNFERIGSVDLANMKDPIEVGLAVTSHSDGKLSTAVFSNVALKFTKITDVEEIASNAMPQQFSLSQNYPNPFNPTTRLTYGLPHQTKIKIIIYDVLGREVETLVDGVKPAGSYVLEFNASSLSSGMYFCSLQYDKQRITRKMMLLK